MTRATLLESSSVYAPGPSAFGPEKPTFSGVLDILDRMDVASDFGLGGLRDGEFNAVAECTPLAEGIASIKSKLCKPERAVSLATLESARHEWRRCAPRTEDLSERATRVLCADSTTATSRLFVEGLSRAGMLHDKRRCLESIIGAYFTNWRSMEAPARLERLLHESVTRFSGPSHRIDRLRRGGLRLLSSEAADVLAEFALSRPAGLDGVLEHYDIPAGGGLGRAARCAAVLLWADRLVSRHPAGPLRAWSVEFEQGWSQFALSDFVDQTTICQAVDRIVRWSKLEEQPELRDLVCSKLMQHPRLGDPRLLANRARWDSCATSTRDQVVRWLSRHDLAFFFDFVMDQTDDPHGRKRFWLQYIDQVSDCCVALSPIDSHRLRAQVKERVAHARVTGTEDVSAFLMRFRGNANIIAVEFSRPGNALYIYNAREFESVSDTGIRRPVFHLRDDLKNGPGYEESIAHQQRWEERVMRFLASRSIRPGWVHR